VATYTQTDRLVSVSTQLGPDALMLTDFVGVEAVSMLFHFRLDLLSENAKVPGRDLLRTPLVISIQTEDGGERNIHGLINRFAQLGQRDDLTAYRAEVVPWLWFLTRSVDSKVFQNLSVPEIAEEVFKSLGYTDFEFKCGSHPKREYCVQYRETHFDFISRLFEEEGIFYFFQHSDSKHTMVIADSNAAMVKLPGRATLQTARDPKGELDVVTSIVREDAIHVGKMTVRNYDFLQPSLGLLNTIEGDGMEEVYFYPERHTTPEEGERLARLRLELEEAQGRIVRGDSTYRHLVSGHRFTLAGHFDPELNHTYVLTQVRHAASSSDPRSWGSETSRYQNTFMAIPADVPYRPARVTRKSLIYGTQTARVVGPAGEEIYVDAHSRVKVQFYWDRLGKKDEHSSCWVRVASTWAGKQWGMIHIPRIGQEVVVQFLEGDPDQPIIVGSVYNAEQPPPFSLPDNKTQSGVRSRSSLGGGPDTCNEIRMEDKKGSEQLFIHAEKNQDVEVENDRTLWVGHDETTTVDNDRTESVGNDETITIGGNRTESVQKDESITVTGARTESVGKDESVTIGASRTASVAKDETLDVGQSQTISIGKDETRSVGANRTTQVGKDDSLQVGKKLIINAGDQIVLKTGSASITMKKNGDIVIKGKDITMDASGAITGKASKNVALKGSKVLNN
jgi:type VI secretion system secreted protein VgrG